MGIHSLDGRRTCRSQPVVYVSCDDYVVIERGPPPVWPKLTVVASKRFYDGYDDVWARGAGPHDPPARSPDRIRP